MKIVISEDYPTRQCFPQWEFILPMRQRQQRAI
jgi:hypothetical protein